MIPLLIAQSRDSSRAWHVRRAYCLYTTAGRGVLLGFGVCRGTRVGSNAASEAFRHSSFSFFDITE